MDLTLKDILIDYFEAHGQLAKQLHEASSYNHACFVVYSSSQITLLIATYKMGRYSQLHS